MRVLTSMSRGRTQCSFPEVDMNDGPAEQGPETDGVPDLLDDAVIQCPFPTYEYLREKRPVYYYQRGNFYIISNLSDIRFALANPTLFSNNTLGSMGFTAKLRSVL